METFRKAPSGRLIVFRQGRGFTLVELVACIVILGILTAVVAPNFADNSAFASRGYADELASSLRYAQRVAVATNCDVQVNITAASYNSFQRLTFATCTTASAWSRAVMRPDGTALSGTAPTGVTASPAVTVQFLSDGKLAGGNVSITVGSHIVSVDSLTGHVTLQ